MNQTADLKPRKLPIMKKTVLIIIALLASLSMSAQEETAFSATVDVTYASKYVFRGVQLADETLMPSVEIGYGNFAAGAWSAQPITSNIDNEIDFYAGFSMPIDDTWGVDIGATIYYYPELDTAGGTVDDYTFEPYIGIGGEVNGISTGVTAYYDTTLETLTLEGSLGYSVPLEGTGSSLDFGASYGHVDPNGGSGYNYYNLGISIPFAISDTATITVSIDYANSDLPGPDTDFIFGTIGMSIGF